MKIGIIGAGAMGSLYASYLSKNNEVILLDTYQKQVDKVNNSGILVVENDNSENKYYPKAYLSGTDIGVVDLVIVFVKSTHTYQAVKMNRSIIGKDTVVMTLQNGAGNNTDIANFVDEDRIIVGTTSHNCVSQGLGECYHSGKGPTNIGPNIPGEKINIQLNLVKTVFDQANLETNILDNIQRVLWSKIFVNCGVNGLTMVMDCKIGEIHNNPELWDLVKNIVYECVLIAEADGTYFERSEALESVRSITMANSTGVASMCQDRRNKRLTEIDKINGVIVKLGQKYNIDAPYNRMLVKMVHAVENTYLTK
jgi:2-dehydropantoate 2-reductase